MKLRFALAIFALTTGPAVTAAAQEAPPVTAVAPAAIAADPANRLNLTLSNGGTVTILLRPDAAPNHVHRLQSLATQGFYNGLTFHRVIPGFMAQGGDPKGTGEGGSPLPDLKAEFNPLPHLRGALSMARMADNSDSGNSQFFIMLSTDLKLDRQYTVLGRVIAGMQFVDQIEPGEPPAAPTRIVRAWIDGPLPAPPAQPAAEPQAEAAPAQ
jgi:cyclophilin family peptidyl-prolyl cis-trans isomerase